MKTKKFLVLYLSILFVFVLIRAWVIPFSHDECQSYTIFAEHSSQGNTANNHWLNTWTAYPFYLLFGESEFALRFPNLLIFALYLVYCFKWAIKFKNFEVQFLTVVLLTAFPFMLDFFSMMRGYGMSFSFALAALYHLVALAEDREDKKQVEKALYFSLLAVLANFTMLIFYCAVVCMVGILLLQQYKKELFTVHFKKIILRPLVINAVVLYYVLNWVLFLKSQGQLYYGSEGSFLMGTVQSLAMVFFYKDRIEKGTTYMPLVDISSVILIVLVLYSFWRYKSNKGFFNLGVFVGILFTIPIALRYTLGFKYPLDRGAILFYIPAILLLPYFLQDLVKRHKVFNVLSKGITLSLLSVWLFYFAVNANFSYFCMWQYDASTPYAVSQMKNNTDSVSIACSWPLEPSVNFYRKKFNILADRPTKTEVIKDEMYDFYLVFKNEAEQLPQQKIVLLKSFPLSNVQMYRLK